MTALVGAWLLILAAAAAAFGTVTALGPSALLPRGRDRWTRAIVGVASGVVLVAYGLLTAAFVRNDFVITYVARNSNEALPLAYRIAAVWGEHAGSLFLWDAVLAVVGVVLVVRGRPLRDEDRVTLGVVGVLLASLSGSLALTTDFFAVANRTLAGTGSLNPILQDPAMASHPPLLYLGYAALAVPFAISIGALWQPHSGIGWSQRARPWLLLGWVALTVSLVAGSWWSHYELGWGGWWFWDPLENAALIPWLFSTALIHALAATGTRGLWPSWSHALAIAAFASCVLGVLLGRVGAFSSIHTFANDPDSAWLTAYPLAIVLLAALGLWWRRRPTTDSPATFHWLSREAALLLASALLALVGALISLGTLYGPVSTALTGNPVAVGGSYFDLVFLPPILVATVGAAVGMQTAWGHTATPRLGLGLLVGGSVAIAVGIGVPWLVAGNPSVVATAGLAAGALVVAGAVLPPATLSRRAPRTLAAVGMHIAHAGLGLCLIGITWATAYGVEADFRAAPGEPVDIAGYTVTLVGTTTGAGPNYAFTRGEFALATATASLGRITSEKRDYRDNRPWLTEAGILGGWNRDVLVQLGEPLGNGAWSVRVQYRPLVRAIWLGGALMAAGGLLAAVGRRRHRHAAATTADPAPARAPTATPGARA